MKWGVMESDATIHAGVVDGGHKGAVSATMQIVNLHGLRLTEIAKPAQLGFHQMSEPVMGYRGTY